MMAGARFVEPPEARFYRHRVGDVELIALSDGGLNYPTAMILGNVPAEAASQFKLPERQMFIPYTILLCKTEDNLVLNDVGQATLGTRETRPSPAWITPRQEPTWW